MLRGYSFEGPFYAVDGPLTPLPTQPGSPPLWVGSWGSDAGMRRVARLGDGWLASAYNIGPDEFGRAWTGLRDRLGTAGRDPETFENAVGTMWFHIDPRRCDEVLSDPLAPVMHRPVEQLRQRLAFGPGCGRAREGHRVPRRRGPVDVRVARGEGPGGDLEQLYRFHDEVMTRMDG